MTALPVQSRTASLVEPLANVILGFVLAVAIQRIAYPLFGIETTLQVDGAIALLFTAASLLRSWCLRRLFVAIERRRRSATNALFLARKSAGSISRNRHNERRTGARALPAIAVPRT